MVKDYDQIKNQIFIILYTMAHTLSLHHELLETWRDLISSGFEPHTRDQPISLFLKRYLCLKSNISQ